MTMKTLKSVLTALIVCCVFFSAQAQTQIDEIVKDWERAKAYTQEYLEAMPESGYDLKPTEEIRSFAEQMLHINDANYAFVSAASGQPVPEGLGQSEKTDDKSKENVTQLVLAGYDYAINSIKKMSPAELKENTTLFGRFEMTKEAAIKKAFEHQTHHRGQTTIYLRLADVKPPAEKLF